MGAHTQFPESWRLAWRRTLGLIDDLCKAWWAPGRPPAEDFRGQPRAASDPRPSSPAAIDARAPSAQPAQTGGRRLHAVFFEKSGKTVEVDEFESLLEAGRRAGLDLPFSCAVGGCGTCRAALAQGQVQQQEPNCLMAHEKAAGEILLCVSTARSALSIRA